MKPVSSDPDNDDSRPDLRSDSESNSGSDPGLSSPLENLQRRYTDQLSQDIEQLEAEKLKLQREVAALRQDYTQLRNKTQGKIHEDGSKETSDEETSEKEASALAKSDSAKSDSTDDEMGSVLSNVPSSHAEQFETTLIPKPLLFEIGPWLPGEETPSTKPSARPHAGRKSKPAKSKSIELPTPATSEQRRARVIQRQIETAPVVRAATHRGLILSAIATILTVCHYGLVGSLTQGGSWLGLEIGQLGVGFVPAVALLWLRMLVTVPALVVLSPQLYKPIWSDLQDWLNTREQLFVPLIGGGVALFISQVLLYQSIGLVGAVVGSALLFLYPLSTVPLGMGLDQGKSPTPFGLVALVAIAMGGFLIARPLLSQNEASSIWLGVIASLFLSLYIVLTNISYRQQCHPVPTSFVQFSTVAVLSSLVLLVKPLEMVSISWLSFCMWGILIGFLALITYLFTYASLRTIGSKTAVVAASTPLAMLVFSWSFKPASALEVIQWTGIFLITLGGVALGKEKVAQR